MFLYSARSIVICLALIAAVCSPSFGDEYHYNNFLIGERASGMGGAYTAVSDDPSGLYYNPAGIVYATGKNLSASVNAFYHQTKKYDNVIGGNGWERTSSSLLPNFFGITQPLGPFTFGFSYAVPDSIREDQDQTFNNVPSSLVGYTVSQYVINFNNEDSTYQFGPSLALEIHNALSAGLTLYYHYRYQQSIMNELLTLTNGINDKFEWRNRYVELHERGWRPMLGVMWSPIDKFSFGLSVSKIFVFNSSQTIQDTVKDANALPDTIDFGTEGFDSKRKYPYQIRAGAAYFPSSNLLLSIDGAYYTEVPDRVTVLNGAVGAEYYWTRNWAVRGGIFTDIANTPDVDSSAPGHAEKVDIYGMSLSVSNFTRNTSITLGGNMTYGTGKAQIISGQTDMQNVTVNGWLIFLSSSYSY